jgi:hypothetical protein
MFYSGKLPTNGDLSIAIFDSITVFQPYFWRDQKKSSVGTQNMFTQDCVLKFWKGPCWVNDFYARKFHQHTWGCVWEFSDIPWYPLISAWISDYGPGTSVLLADMADLRYLTHKTNTSGDWRSFPLTWLKIIKHRNKNTDRLHPAFSELVSDVCQLDMTLNPQVWVKSFTFKQKW